MSPSHIVHPTGTDVLRWCLRQRRVPRINPDKNVVRIQRKQRQLQWKERKVCSPLVYCRRVAPCWELEVQCLVLDSRGGIQWPPAASEEATTRINSFTAASGGSGRFTRGRSLFRHSAFAALHRVVVLVAVLLEGMACRSLHTPSFAFFLMVPFPLH